MSKFDELLSIVETSLQASQHYRDESFKFAGALVQGLADHFEIPKGRMSFVPLDENAKEGATYSLVGAIHLNDDTFWHLGVKINLSNDLNSFPQRVILLRILFKKVDGRFQVKLGNASGQFFVTETKKEEFIPFYDFLFTQIKETYEKNLTRFLEKDETRRLGF